MSEKFKWIKDTYGVPAELHREVLVQGRRGYISSDKGNYIGVTYYDGKHEVPCHPTWEVEYLDTFAKVKRNISKERYQKYLESESSLTFIDWLRGKNYEYR